MDVEDEMVCLDADLSHNGVHLKSLLITLSQLTKLRIKQEVMEFKQPPIQLEYNYK